MTYTGRLKAGLTVLEPIEHKAERLGLVVWRWSDDEGRFVRRTPTQEDR